MISPLGVLTSWLTRKPRCTGFLATRNLGVLPSWLMFLDLLFKYTDSVSDSKFRIRLAPDECGFGLRVFRFKGLGRYAWLGIYDWLRMSVA